MLRYFDNDARIMNWVSKSVIHCIGQVSIYEVWSFQCVGDTKALLPVTKQRLLDHFCTEGGMKNSKALNGHCFIRGSFNK